MHRAARQLGCSAMLAMVWCTTHGRYTTKMYYASEAPSGAVRSTMTHVFAWGLLPVGEANLEALCGQANISELKTQIGPMGFLATVATFGIWTPMRVTATCSERS